MAAGGAGKVAKRTTLLLIDEYALIRQGVRRALEQCPDLVVVGETGNGEDAVMLVQQLQPDVTILDIRLPKLSGAEALRTLKESCPSTKALVLSSYDDDHHILALMEAGAAGYLLKTIQAEDLVEAVRKVARGEPVLDPAIAWKVARLWGRQAGGGRPGHAERLSQRDIEVLRLATKGLRNRVIAERLGLSVRTVEWRFNTIFSKLNISSRTEAVLYAISHGLIAAEEAEGV